MLKSNLYIQLCLFLNQQKIGYNINIDRYEMRYQISRHAQTEMERRKISVSLVESVLENPQQILLEREGRKVYQSKIDFGTGKLFLLRVIVADDVDPTVVITVYRTSKIEKYWREL
ncbi:MAG: DUF4258 domain-containing protein [Sphaerospermopsis kisseleviana]